ncbi:MAG: c(7)-type cytochrome triheme domain-containing protein [Thermoanaerobaculia bacterium]
MNKKLFFVLVPLFFLLLSFQAGVKKKKVSPEDYGKSIINNFSQKAGMMPVLFNHWSHRAKFTCRLCHVDIGFAMKNNETGIKAQDNMEGKYCGACHNGKYEFNGKRVFEACSKDKNSPNCINCHISTNAVKNSENFKKFASEMPKDAFGNEIDWEKAEEQGIIKLIDKIEGFTLHERPKFKAPQNFDLNAKVEGLPEIIFSHKKHTNWMGCEGCHPEIFIGVKKGLTTYSMADIFQGKYCGACHNSVAFPLVNCQKCHIKEDIK